MIYVNAVVSLATFSHCLVDLYREVHLLQYAVQLCNSVTSKLISFVPQRNDRSVVSCHCISAFLLSYQNRVD